MTIDALERLRRIDHLIRIKGTGTAAKLGERVGLSRAAVYEYLNLMKNYGAPIKFCKFRQTFYYVEDGSFMTRFIPAGDNHETMLNSFRKTARILIFLPVIYQI